MLGETGTRKATYAIQVACQAWSKSHERCHVRLARAASSHHTARCKVHKKQFIIKTPPPTMNIVFYSCNRSTYRHGSDHCPPPSRPPWPAGGGRGTPPQVGFLLSLHQAKLSFDFSNWHLTFQTRI